MGSGHSVCGIVCRWKVIGVYLAVEPVTNGESRLRLAEFGLLSGETAYVVNRDRIDTGTEEIETWGKTKG